MSALRWAPPTPDLAEWREAVVPVEGSASRGWLLEVAEWGRSWAWQVFPPWPSFLPVASGREATREAAQAAAEEALRPLADETPADPVESYP
jgi:hypothetical protein